jgi:hypothetical protein
MEMEFLEGVTMTVMSLISLSVVVGIFFSSITK